MKNRNATGKSLTATPHPGVRPMVMARLLAGAALLCMAAGANADQLLVTGANWSGDSVYDLVISPSSTNPSGTTPIVPVIANKITPINSDGGAHGAFDALVWAPNSVCKTLDLIAADASKGQVVRYSGASTLPTCYDPANGTPSVNPTAQIIFKWSKLGSGPARPNGVSADANGNVFVISSSGPLDPKPSVWVLPFNSAANQYCTGAAGTYCAPVLIDNKFSNTLTLALAETLVANAPAVTSTNTVLWNAGDLLVLVGDSFDARLVVYSAGKIYASHGVLATHGLPLTGPTSTPIPWAKFLAQLAAPFGMDLWPAGSALGAGANAGVLFTTIDGRILRFDTVQNKFVGDFADRLGLGLQKLKVGSYANIPYAFVAQLAANGTGQILAFAPPPASGANKPLAAVSKGVMNPVGLAVSSSGVQSVPATCVPPTPCTFTPLGPELVTTVNAYPGDHLSGTVQEQTCSVQIDPRVTIGQDDSWSCPPIAGTTSPAALPIGAGTNYCPSFPSAVIPGSVCGHSGPSGAGFAVIESTATGIDPNDNNSFVTTVGNIDAVMPGGMNLECTNFANTGVIPLMAWGTRSDLTTVEGTIPEDSMFGPTLGGQQGFLTELTSACDTSTSSSRGVSIYAIGLGLSDTSQAYVYTLQNQKFEALQQTVSNASVTAPVQSNLAQDITTAEGYVTAAKGGGDFTSNINCALNEIAATDTYVRANLMAFGSNLVTSGSGGGNPNPAGDIDGRLANWYLTLDTELAGHTPNSTWPPAAGSVPACGAQITSFFIQPASAGFAAGDIDWTSVNTATPASCNLTDLYASANLVGNVNEGSTASGLPSGNPGQNYEGDSITVVEPPSANSPYGVDTYTLTCFGVAGTAPATQSMLVGTSTPAPVAPGAPPNPQLTIGSFSAEVAEDGNDNGNLSWITTNSTGNTVCAITDAYGGAPYNQFPITGLPANMAGYFYNWFCGAALIGSQGPPALAAEPADILTLTCSDPNNGTALRMLTITNPDGCEIE